MKIKIYRDVDGILIIDGNGSNTIPYHVSKDGIKTFGARDDHDLIIEDLNYNSELTIKNNTCAAITNFIFNQESEKIEHVMLNKVANFMKDNNLNEEHIMEALTWYFRK